MLAQWAVSLRDKVKAAGLCFMFKQITHATSGYGYNALDGKDWHEFPPAPNGVEWAPFQPIPEKCKMARRQWEVFMGRRSRTYHYVPNDGPPTGCVRRANDHEDICGSEENFERLVNAVRAQHVLVQLFMPPFFSETSRKHRS
jgi:hypothetical protein